MMEMEMIEGGNTAEGALACMDHIYARDRWWSLAEIVVSAFHPGLVAVNVAYCALK